ncbi:hypothetical protein BDW75DRAFT_244334 [Aspergillus navahoensis]
MGRIISDGGWYFHIADMAVLPEHQRKGLCDVVLKELLRYIKENAPEGEPQIPEDPVPKRPHADRLTQAARKEDSSSFHSLARARAPPRLSLQGSRGRRQLVDVRYHRPRPGLEG